MSEYNSQGKCELSRRELLSQLSPLGKVTMDASKCTGCGLCAVECSTGALSIATNRETASFQLLFKHGNCTACDKCAEICPEKCLKVERSLEPEKINSQTVFFGDTIVMCSGCGSPIGPKTMVEKLQKALAGRQPGLSELCPECKVRALGSPRASI